MMTTVSPEAIAEARAQARVVCDGHGLTAEQRHDVLLVLSELVANGCRHGWPPISYDIAADSGDLIVMVEDCNPAPPVAPGDAPDDAETGRGLHLVAEFSRLWGWFPVDAGKVVWARM